MNRAIAADWPAAAHVHAFTTTREGGVSRVPFDSFNLGSRCGDEPARVEANRARLRGSLPDEPAWLCQVHGKDVVDRSNITAAEPEADAVISFQPGKPCSILTADCLPVLFCDRAGTRVAAAHAGWRGLAAGVLEATVLALDCPPGELLAWLGPAISVQAFEVGPEVRERFLVTYPGCARAFHSRDGSLYCDLYAIARIALAESGVGQVCGGDHCTYTEQERFFSYRRDGSTGRMASVVWFE